MANYLLNWGAADKQTSLAEERIRRVLPDLIRADSIAKIMAQVASWPRSQRVGRGRPPIRPMS